MYDSGNDRQEKNSNALDCSQIFEARVGQFRFILTRGFDLYLKDTERTSVINEESSFATA